MSGESGNLSRSVLWATLVAVTLLHVYPQNAAAARALRWFGIDRAGSRPSPLGEREYDLRAAGYKYHMNDLAAAVGLGNLQNFPQRLARRQRIGAHYREALANVPGLQLLRLDPDRTHAYWIFTVLVEQRESFIRELAEQGIPASVVHRRIDRNTLFGSPEQLPGQERFDAYQVSIPVHEGLSDAEVERIVSVIHMGW